VLRAQISGEGHPLRKQPITLTCKTCGVEFEAKPCFANSSKRFCSRQCVGAYVTANSPRVSSIEVMTAAHLDARGVAYRQQVPIGRFVADFMIGSTVVEVDGTYWHSLPVVVARDERKNAEYARRGLNVVRITEAEVRAGDWSAIKELLA